MTRSFTGSPAFTEGARIALANPQLRTNLANATTTIRAKRNARVAELETWEDLRLAGEAIKNQTLAKLSDLLVEFETNVTRAGGHVHWARDAAEARAIVRTLVETSGARDVVKIKSMTTAEIELNQALELDGVRAYETDLAELIIQLGDDLPSHIVVPAIHRSRDEVRTIFLDHMGEWGRPAPADLSSAPDELARAARSHLRERFLAAEVGVSGANFLVAETGSVAIIESEGNGRMCLTLPDTLITIAGIDKVVPSFSDLDIFFQLVPRSATGERMNPYNSTWTGVTPGDGPQQFHVVLLDNGRSRALADRVGREALRCVRCAACLNVCPVYERVGGHAYGSVYPGPIGAVLTPQLDHVASDEVAASLPYASTLCGACFEVCPVRIDIPKLLVHLRGEVVANKTGVSQERLVMSGAAWLFSNPARLRLATALGTALNALTRGRVRAPGWLDGWTRFRRAPLPNGPSFDTWWRRTGRPVTTSPATRARPAAPPPRPTRAATATDGDARTTILAAIEFANEHVAPVTVPRAYRREPPTTDVVERFTARVNDYRATATVVDADELGATIVALLEQRSSRSVVVPSDRVARWTEGFDGDVAGDDGNGANPQDATPTVITACRGAIAETGTIVLNAGPDEGRRIITLIPDHHIVVVEENQIVADVPDVMTRLDPTRPTTWISGPSATSDIELRRVEGVHGPRVLDVLIVRR
ncbi:MAG: LUD domain-containing protein [Acidimicrobiales bacterium]